MFLHSASYLRPERIHEDLVAFIHISIPSSWFSNNVNNFCSASIVGTIETISSAYTKMETHDTEICFPPHLNNVSTLPCETWNDHMTRATTELSEKETQEVIPPQLWPHIRQIWMHLITPREYYSKRRCTENASLIWTNWNSNWEQSGPSWAMSSLRQPFVSAVVESFRSVMRVLCTSCNISHMLLSTEFKSGEFGGHSWDDRWRRRTIHST